MQAIHQDIKEIWQEFAENRSSDVRNKLILKYIWLVKYVLNQMNLPINTILNDEDFLSIGILGLNESIERYDKERGVKFESYAIPRIKGMVQDELRRIDWLSRTARKRAHEYVQAQDELRSEVGREVTSEEVMRKLNVTEEEYNVYLAAAAAAKASFSFADTQAKQGEDETDFLEEIPDTSQESALAVLQSEERIRFITDYISKLSEKKRLVISLYYYESITFKEIGKLLKVSESRVCQIHTQVIKDLREKINEFDNA